MFFPVSYIKLSCSLILLIIILSEISPNDIEVVIDCSQDVDSPQIHVTWNVRPCHNVIQCHNYTCTIACILVTVTFIGVFKVQNCIAHYIYTNRQSPHTIVSHFHSLLMVNHSVHCVMDVQACANVQL